MTVLTGFGFNAEEQAKERSARRDAEIAREATVKVYTDELRGIEHRRAMTTYELERVDAALANAEPHWRAPIEAERDALLRVAHRLAGKAELVRIEMKRVAK